MKRIVLVALVVAVATYAASAWSAGSAGPTPARLQQEITALQKQVKTLQSNLKQTDQAALAALVLTLCNSAITADALQGTWQEVDQVTARTTFGPQTPVPAAIQGQDVCALVQVARSQALPPTTGAFQQLLAGAAARRYATLLHAK